MGSLLPLKAHLILVAMNINNAKGITKPLYINKYPFQNLFEMDLIEMRTQRR